MATAKLHYSGQVFELDADELPDIETALEMMKKQTLPWKTVTTKLANGGVLRLILAPTIPLAIELSEAKGAPAASFY